MEKSITTNEFLSKIRDMGINLWLDGDNLRYSAPKGTLTQELRTELAKHKPEILTILRKAQAVTPSEYDEIMPEPDKTYVAARTPIEKTLAKIWREILDLEKVSIYDNFFHLGGDSLLVLQVVNKARESGLQLAPYQVFKQQTIVELAKVEGVSVIEAEQGVVTGALPLIPNSMAYFRTPPQPWWRLFEALFLVPPGLNATRLAQIVQHLIMHHDGLRLRIVQQDSNYQQFIASSDDEAFLTQNLSDMSKAEQEKTIAKHIENLWVSINLATGPLLRFVYYDLGKDRPARLLILIHHFVADEYSIQILLDDFQTACQQLMQEQSITLPPKTTSLKRWAERMYTYVQSSAWEKEVNYWLSLPWKQVRPIPTDYPDNFVANKSSNLASGTYVCSKDPEYVVGTLSATETHSLVQKISKTYDATIPDLLLTGLLMAFDQWIKLQTLYLLIISNGRGSVFEDIDVSRSVGDFAGNGIYPTLLTSCGSSDPIHILKSVKEQLKRIPNGGLTCYWGQTHAGERMSANMPSVLHLVFNYHGYIEEKQESLRLFDQVATPSNEEPTHPETMKSDRQQYTVSHPFQCDVRVLNKRFEIQWQYRDELHKKATVEKLVQLYLKALRTLAESY